VPKLPKTPRATGVLRMQEMLAITGALQGRGLGNDVAFITDGRFSGATHGSVSETGPVHHDQISLD
jgi:dihydroxyacid dehydratase/phosphogluconate dehydratase